MSKVLEKAKERVKALGYELVSTEYKTLDTSITVKCLNCGNISFTTLKELRKRKSCENCKIKSEDLEPTLRAAEIGSNILPPKKSRRLLILDQSTTNCGWAIFENGKLLDFGVKSLPKEAIEIRIAELNDWFVQKLHEWEIDGVGIEDIQLQQDPLIYKKLAMLMGVLINSTIAEIEEIPIIKSSSEWCNKCGIHAKYRDERKRLSQARVKALFNKSVSQDAADAINLGTYISFLDAQKRR